VRDLARTIVGESTYHRLFAEFPGLTCPPVFRREKTRHGVENQIKTTPEPPTCSKPRRLAPDRLKEAKIEFELMIKQGVIRSSKNPWVSPLHVVSKKDGGLRLCGDCGTVPDRYSPPHVEDFAQQLYDKRIFSKIDSGCDRYLTVRTNKVEKTEIATQFVLFETVNTMFGV
jgi:hypothetical protein